MTFFKKIFFITLSIWLLFSLTLNWAGTDSAIDEEAQIAAMEQAIKENPDLAKLLSRGDPKLRLRIYNKGKEEAEQAWQDQQANIQKIKNMGATESLEILPLIDWYTKNENLKGEAGVSYLIKTDNSTILFDLGLNKQNSDPSPLLSNMKELGISLDDFDTIVISHNHGDHVGGSSWMAQRTFSLTNQQIELGSKRVFNPIPMTYPGLSPVVTENPTKISEGVMTIGTISNQMFFIGLTPEQALAVNVKGKGIVLIVGCGHQTLAKILARTSALFDQPIYGLVGGLHYPVTDSRQVYMGWLKIQKYFGTGKLPWEPITIEEVNDNIRLLKEYNPQIVGLSPHDSCDTAIAAFRNSFQTVYKEVIVGERIVIKGP